MTEVDLLSDRFTNNKLQVVAAKNDTRMPLRVRKILRKVGDRRILKIQLGRTPVKDLNRKMLNFLSDSKFTDKQLELGYDEIYHNYLLITIMNTIKPDVLHHILRDPPEDTHGTTILKLEKIHRIALKYPTIPDDFADVYDIPLTPDKPWTLNRLISTASNVDKIFYKYDAAENDTCQTFVENIIEINDLTKNIVDQATLDALKPIDSKALMSTLGSRSGIVKLVTDVGAKLDSLVFDHRIKWKKCHPKEFVSLRNNDVICDAIFELEKHARGIVHSSLSVSSSEASQ